MWWFMVKMTILSMICTCLQVLNKCREIGLKLNPEKCQFGEKEVKFYGNIISSDGVKPDPVKVDVILNMPSPKSKLELASFLGMCNYLSTYIPRFIWRHNCIEINLTRRKLTLPGVPPMKRHSDRQSFTLQMQLLFIISIQCNQLFSSVMHLEMELVVHSYRMVNL